MKKLLFAIMVGSLIAMNAIAAESSSKALSLPEKLLELNVTKPEKLGSRENELGLPVGTKVPDFHIKTYDGKPVTFTELMKNAPLLVIFYRGGWCPFCNFQVRQLSQAFPDFQKQGVEPVLISADEVEGAVLVRMAYEVPFPLLSDPDLAAHEAFQVTLAINDVTFNLYKYKYGLDLEAWSRRLHHKIAIPSVFLIDKTGTVQWAHLALDYTTRPNPEQLLKMIAIWQQSQNQ